MIDKAKATLYLATDRPHVLREAIYSCRKGGTISVPGVYVGLIDHIPFGAAMNKGLDLPDGSDPYAALSRAAAGEGRKQARSILPLSLRTALL